MASVVTKAAVVSAAAAVPKELAGLPSWLISLVVKLQHLTTPEGAVLKRKVMLAVLLFGGGATIASKYLSKKTQRSKEEQIDGGNKKQKVAVDAIFFRRLLKILKIVIPSVTSIEMVYLLILTCLLFARTFFSIAIAEIIGRNGQSLVSRNWPAMWDGIKKFAIITVPASAVNSGLKYFAQMLALRFRVRLSHHVHDVYLKGVNFYKACNLGGENRIDNADQRVTADIDSFCTEISNLYTSLCKPVLDVCLFTYKLGTLLGWQGPACMHAYFVLSGWIKRAIMPSFGKLVALESELEGQYRTAHQRLITNSEEIAFYDGSQREKHIINNALECLNKHISHFRYLKALVAVFDGLLVKYYASIAGYFVLLSPLVLNLEQMRGKNSEELTRDYIRNSQFLSNLSTAVSELVLVGNKLTNIAGYTHRVSELLEMVNHLNNAGNRPFEIKAEENPEMAPAKAKIVEEQKVAGLDIWIEEWKKRCETQRDQRLKLRQADRDHSQVVGGGVIIEGDSIIFDHVDIVSPEGKILVRGMNVRVDPGVNYMVTGPNGVGKSSLFRVIGELWPLHCGNLTKPRKEEILFVPQKPYLVLGTLRDQIIYPHNKQDMEALGITDEDLRKLLAIVDPAENIANTWSWDIKKDWFHAFSGGQKQRVAMARLFYHRPKFAILDECTSAVSDEIEDKIYETCSNLGITIFTVSHRVSLARHHNKILRFLGHGRWSVTDVNRAALPKNLSH